MEINGPDCEGCMIEIFLLKMPALSALLAQKDEAFSGTAMMQIVREQVCGASLGDRCILLQARLKDTVTSHSAAHMGSSNFSY